MIDTEPLTEAINWRLDDLLIVIKDMSEEAIATNHIPTIVACFQKLRATVDAIDDKLKPFKAHVNSLSRNEIPTIFFNQKTKTITVDNVGRVTVNVDWSAKPYNKAEAFQWLRDTGNGGLIQETVHHETLGLMAREAALAGRPLPENLFKVSTSNHLSITKV